ncbi:hypothetical protein ISU10_11205 [Nocardioides agariphilus]|uniref:Uncharacterized protein n=1 Tax=Nocardioides agariphilus TaxID=433664 RepID=A0A930VIV2_9ACTN|nr:hypothetical protein [Nocardioides agariphilus]MBF4768334.1 hypothetical protein [Nocardioides agariphilus]
MSVQEELQAAHVNAGWLDAYIDSPPAEAHVRVNGDTPLRRVERLRDRWAKQQRAKQTDRYAAVLTPARESVKDADKTVDLLSDKISGWLDQMRAGTLDPEQVMKNLADVPAVLKAIQQAYDECDRDAEAARAMIDLPPAEYAQRLEERFPSAGHGIYLTTAWLRGEPGAQDPLGDA